MSDAQKTNSPTPRTDKALEHSDPIAALIGTLLGICGALGLLSKMGISADDTAVLLGFVGSAVAGFRAVLESRRRRAHAPPVEKPDWNLP